MTSTNSFLTVMYIFYMCLMYNLISIHSYIIVFDLFLQVYIKQILIWILSTEIFIIYDRSFKQIFCYNFFKIDYSLCKFGSELTTDIIYGPIANLSSTSTSERLKKSDEEISDGGNKAIKLIWLLINDYHLIKALRGFYG